MLAARLTRTDGSKSLERIDAGVVPVTPLDADGVAADDVDLQRMDVLRHA
jgi:hypothetical protein